MQMFSAPSGAVFTSDDMDLLKQLFHVGFVTWKKEPVVFKSKKTSQTYVRGRQDLTNNPHLLFERLAPRVVDFVRKKIPIHDGRQHCLIGIPTAGTKLAMAAAAYGYYRQVRPGIIYRELRVTKKTHGEDNTWAVGGPEHSNDVYVTVEQAMSTGSSILEHLGHLKEEGYAVHDMHHLILVDRELGGVENLVAHRFEKVHVLFKLRDIIAALVEMGLWSAERYQILLGEIEEAARLRE